MQNNFGNRRGLNLSDPKFDKDAVNFRTLTKYISDISGSTSIGIWSEGDGLNSAVLDNGNGYAGGSYSLVGGGLDNTVSDDANYSAVIGGINNRVITGVINSVIIGGAGISANQNNSLYTQNARLAEEGGIVFSAGTDLYNIFSTKNTFINNASYEPLENKITLTNNESNEFNVIIEQFSALTIINNLNVQGQILSGNTDLYDIFLTEETLFNEYGIPLTAKTELDNELNWDINGNYTGSTAIDSTLQGQSYYNNNYYYAAVDDNNWIRLIRG
jgi:hypothetical protein